MTSALSSDSLLSEDRALETLDWLLQQAGSSDTFASLSATEGSLSRFANNQIVQNLGRSQLQMTVVCARDRRSGSAATTDLDRESLLAALASARELASVAPEDPEWMPLLAPQTYENRQPAFDLATAEASPLARSERVRDICQTCQSQGLEGSGTLSSSARLRAVGNTLGLRACNRTTEAEFSFTARIGTGSSWNRRTAWALGDLPCEDIAAGTLERAIASQNPQEIEPGTYPTIFSPAALADLVPVAVWNLDARAADEGRSFMSGEADGNRLGERLFSPLVQLSRDPSHPLLCGGTFDSSGLPQTRLDIVTDGVPRALAYSRYWAQQQGKTPTGSLFPLVMAGGESSLEAAIAQTERGIFVSRAWYVRYVNPKTLEVTGMTRDGTFWIEGGKLAYPIKNLRFNQSLPEMLRDVDLLTVQQRCGSSVIPGARVAAFRFSSVTESI